VGLDFIKKANRFLREDATLDRGCNGKKKKKDQNRLPTTRRSPRKEVATINEGKNCLGPHGEALRVWGEGRQEGKTLVRPGAIPEHQKERELDFQKQLESNQRGTWQKYKKD